MMTKHPLILLDSPEDGICEEFGWVETIVSVDEARTRLQPYCIDRNGNPNYLPTDEPVKVWLAPANDENWVPAASTDPGAVEFYLFDVEDFEDA